MVHSLTCPKVFTFIAPLKTSWPWPHVAQLIWASAGAPLVRKFHSCLVHVQDTANSCFALIHPPSPSPRSKNQLRKKKKLVGVTFRFYVYFAGLLLTVALFGVAKSYVNYILYLVLFTCIGLLNSLTSINIFCYTCTKIHWRKS